MKRSIGPDGKPIGNYNQNHILDLRKYKVELPYGLVDEYYHNIISENLFLQVDEKGREFVLMKEIIDHSTDRYGIRKWKKGLITTKVWKLIV